MSISPMRTLFGSRTRSLMILGFCSISSTCQIRSTGNTSFTFKGFATCAMDSMPVSTLYRVPALDNLTIGQSISASSAGSQGPTMVPGAGWQLPAGAYTPRQIVHACAPLLETVLHHLGEDPVGGPTAREMLLDNLSSNLAVDTRESSLHLQPADAGRKEMTLQAIKIGRTIVQYAKEPHDVPIDSRYVIRSPCEGHLLKEQVAQLMFGPRSRGHLMQIYNEYLHQMVLLRDVLLPFENYEDLIIPIASQTKPLGLRFTETRRTMFLAELLTKSLKQKSLFKVAQDLLLPRSQSVGGYALQFSHGLILPAILTGSQSPRLLSYIPAHLNAGQDTIFASSIPDYYTSPRTEITAIREINDSPTPIKGFSLSTAPSNETGAADVQYLFLQLQNTDGETVKVDVGQVARGYRYAYDISKKSAVSSSTGATAANRHAPWSILRLNSDGLVTDKHNEVHLTVVDSQIFLLAVLGSLYPENVIIVGSHQSEADTLSHGKGLVDGPRFVVSKTF